MSESDPKEAPSRAKESDWKEAFVKKINEKVSNSGICKECGKSQTQLAPDVVTPMISTGGGVSIGGNSYPQAMVVCANCGHTRYFNLVALGIDVPGAKK